MNRDDIARMAREAGYFLYDLTETHGKKTVETDEDDEWAVLERFANLVAAAEREACLAILRDMEGKKWHTAIHGGEMKGVSLHDAYAAIRARGEA